MESKQQFTDKIRGLGQTYFEYLNLLFKNCPDQVIHAMRYMKVPKGYVLIHAGAPCDSVYIILSGNTIGIDFQRLGNAYIFREYFSTDVLGDFELFGDIGEYCISIRAVTECEVVVIPAAVYLKWMQSDINALFMRTRKLMNDMTLDAAVERKYFFLNCKDRMVLFLVEEYEKKGKGETHRVKKTQPELAERLGFNTRTIQRSIQSLEEAGLISVEKGKICLSLESYWKLKDYMERNLLS